MKYGMLDLAAGFVGIKQNKEKLRKDEFWAVKDVSFELRRGECLGLIGHNGAGKSTLLKMLNGLIKPDEGEIIMRGRVGALIELGAGFNPILTGRENIYVNGQILGFTKEEIDRKFDDIVEFAEIAEFIDSPVQNYSSGMKVRLGFAVAAQMEPDVLLIDEVLAVGDLSFRMKCFDHINMIITKNKVSIILVSHSMIDIMRICQKGILFKQGRLIKHDVIDKVVAKYNIENSLNTRRIEQSSFKIHQSWLQNDLLEITNEFKTNDSIYLNFIINSNVHYENVRFNIHIDTSSIRLNSTSSILSGFKTNLIPGENHYQVKLINLPLLSGGFVLFYDAYGSEIKDLLCCSEPIQFYITSENIDYYGYGHCHILKIDCLWKKK